MIKYLLLSAFLAIAGMNGFSQAYFNNSVNQANEANSHFVRFDHSGDGYDYFWLNLNMFKTDFERAYYYTLSANNEIVIADKNKYQQDSALFVVKSSDGFSSEPKIEQLYDLTIKTSESLDDISKNKFLNNLPFTNHNNSLSNLTTDNDSPLGDPDCSTAEVSCSGNTYSFPSGTQGSATSSGGYPDFGCLGSTPCPAWYYMQVGAPGDINIHISQQSNDDPPVGLDVDFICWGPFNSLTDGCNTGLTAGNIVDCSYSGAPQEDCFIPNAQVGEIYILLMTNFSQQPGTITFAQTGGLGVTNCDIVLNCGIIAVTANPSTCSAATNTFSVTGNLEFVNAPAAGTLTVTDVTSVPNVSQTFTAPFSSPQAYTFPNVTCDGALHTITAVFSAEPTCSLTNTYNAPTSICPAGTINGGGAICNNGTSTTSVLINIVGVGPFDFTYALNGVPQAPVMNYNGPFPYVITTGTPGTYTLLAVSNAACPGTTSGSATVVLDPLPVPTITGINDICIGSSGITYTTQPGKQNYIWTITGGIITAGQGSNAINVTWNTAGAQTLTVSYLGPPPTNCAPVTPAIYNVNIVAAPVSSASNDTTICQGQSVTIAGALVANQASYSWAVVSGSGALSGSGTLSPTYTPAATETGDVVLSLTAAGLSTCSAASDQVVIHILPMVTASAGTDNSMCQNSTFTVNTATSAHYSSLLWTTNGTGTLTGQTTLTPTYTPGPGETGTVTFTLTANGNSPCGVLSDSMQTDINPLPLADAGPSGTSCQGVNYTVSGATAQFNSSVTWTEDGPGSLVNANSLTPTYVPLPGETGIITLTLTAQGSNTCSAETVTDTRTLTINPLPDVDAGIDATICAANTFTVAGSQQFTSSVQWTTSGDGVFTNSALVTNVYTPGPNDILSGSVVLTLTGAGSGVCSLFSDVDQMSLTINPMPAINAGPDGAFCVTTPIAITGTSASNYSALQWISSGDGAYNNSTVLSPTYMPGNIDFNNGTVTLTLRAYGQLACLTESVIDTRIISVSAYPLVNAGSDDYICSNITQYQLNGVGNNYNLGNILWTFSGGDGMLSNPNSMNPVYTAGPIDLSTMNRNITFTLTVQGTGNCSGIFINDQVILKIDPTPISNSGPDDETCGRNPYQLNATAQFQSIINWTTSGDGFFSNNGILNPTYTPGPNDVGNTVVLTLDLSGCKSISGADFLWLTVHPDPSATISGTTSICEGSSSQVNIALTGTPPWSVSYTNGVTPVTVNNIMSSPYTFGVNPAVTTNWWLTAANDAFCTAPADSIDGLVSITVFPLPDKFTATVTDNGVFCEGTPGVFIGLNDSQLGMNYELWQNGLFTGTVRPGTGDPLNFGIVNVPGQYYVRGINPAGNCEAMMNDTLNVIMNPIPVTDFTATTPCFGDSTVFTVSGQFINSTSYWQWNFGDGKFETFNAPTNPKHFYAAPGIYNVSLSVGDTNNCLYSVTHQVEVRSHPVAFFSFDTPNCLGTPTSFTDLSSNPGGQGYLNQWTWDFGDGSPSVTIDYPASPNLLHEYISNGTFEVTLSVKNSRNCSDTYSTTINVTKRPIGNFTFISGCQQESASFTDLTDPNGGGALTTWNWNFGDPTSGALNFSTLEDPTHIFSTPGTFTVTLIVTNLNGCSDTIQKAVQVKAKPLANFFHTPGCLGSSTLFLADSTLINIAATATYLWDFGDGATAFSRNTTHTYLAPGTYDVTLTITDTAGCAGDTSLPVTVNPPPTAHFTANTDNCQGQAVAFTNLSTSPTGFISQWVWDFGDGNTQTIVFPATANTTHSYSGAGTFSVSLTVTNNEGCTHSESRLINILGAPTSNFMSSGQCVDQPVAFTDLSTTSGTQTISSWLWNFGDPTSGTNNTSTQKNPTHTYAAAATYAVTLITFTGNNCSDTLVKNITIKPVPAVDFSTQSACAGNPATFTPTGMATATIAGWYWMFGDGGNSNQQAPTHVYTSSGTYTVTLTVTDTAGCSNTHSKPIVIAPVPNANFGYTAPTCQGDAVSFSDMSSTASGFVAWWHWDFGDGNTQTITFPDSPDVTHPYANAGTFNVTLTVKTSDSCTNQLTRVLIILPKPTSDFMHGAACQGNAVSFTDMSTSNTTGTISGWLWIFGDPTSGTSNTSTLQNPVHTYATAGTYTVQLVVSIPGGCSDTASHQVTVSAPPSVDFTPVAGCNGDTTLFTSTVNLATTQGWYWQFGDGGTSFVANPVHIYATSGTYTVTLTITDTAGCTNVKVKPVTVIPGPVAAFSSSTPGCSGLPITFTDLSTANGGTLSNWYWTFGDGTDTTYSGFTANLSHTYAQPGTFLVTLHVLTALGCEHTVQQTVSLSPSPLAGFTYANTCQGQGTQFTDQTSLNGGGILTQREWNFGDPASGILNTSTQTNPVHYYTQAGPYVVTLVTLNTAGCADTLQQTITISPKPGVDFYNDSLVCLGNITTLYTDTTVTNTSAIQYYEWDFGDGSPHAFTQNASHQYTVAGTFTVTLTVQDTAGCENAKAHPLTIHTAAVSSFTYQGVCEDAPVQFTDQSQPPAGGTIESWYWDFGITGASTDTSTQQNPAFTYALPGTYSVSLTTTTENGCQNTLVLPLQVWNTPTAWFNYTASPCANGQVQFQDSSWSYQGTVSSWQWEFEPYQFGSGTNPTHQYYAVDSCYEVTLVVEDMRGCVDTLQKQVCVPPALTVDFNTTQTCYGTPVTFTPELLTPAAPADSLTGFSWNFGDPATGSNNVSGQKYPVHTFSSTGYYSVSFTATDKFGCTATRYRTVQVHALPAAQFTYTPGQCDSTLVFSSTSSDTSSVINTYIWHYGDGTSDTLTVATSTHKYATAGDYLATLTVINANGCTDSYSDTVTRSACLVAAYLATNSLLCQNQVLTFADMSTCDGDITQWKWDFGDGTPSTIYATYRPWVTHTYQNPGVYTLSLKVSTQAGASTLSDSTGLEILVKPTPLAGFTVKPVCLGTEAEFSDTTQANGATVLSFRWEFGDAGTADTSNLRHPEYLYTVPGEYTTELIVKNQFGCADTVTSPVMVNGLPDAAYASSLACSGQQTYFFDASQPYIAPLSTWGWWVNDSVGPIGNMQGATPSFAFDSAGMYQVMLTVADTNGCYDTIVQHVTVHPSPVSAFSYTENVDNLQGQVQFTNGSLGAEEYYWDFGNGEISYAESPLITYAGDGTYQVMLVTVSDQACHDTAIVMYDLMFKGLYVPNAMAPGGTIQATRSWKPVGVNLASYLVEVYNSHGMLLWKSSLLDESGAPAESWDGTYGGKPCQQDVYVWKITAVFRDGTVWYNQDVGEHEGLSEPVYGTITMIR